MVANIEALSSVAKEALESRIKLGQSAARAAYSLLTEGYWYQGTMDEPLLVRIRALDPELAQIHRLHLWDHIAYVIRHLPHVGPFGQWGSYGAAAKAAAVVEAADRLEAALKADIAAAMYRYAEALDGGNTTAAKEARAAVRALREESDRLKQYRTSFPH